MRRWPLYLLGGVTYGCVMLLAVPFLITAWAFYPAALAWLDSDDDQLPE